MTTMARSKIAFYGNRNDIMELKELINRESKDLFEKLIPTPVELVGKTGREIGDWRTRVWGTTWWNRTSSKIVHLENYSIYYFEFECPFQPPFGILLNIYNIFNQIKSVSLTEFDFNNSMMVVRRDPKIGFRKCIEHYYDDEKPNSRRGDYFKVKVSDKFLLDWRGNPDLSDALKMIGLELPEITQILH